MNKPDEVQLVLGEHYWLLVDQKLVVGMYTGDSYELCGPWECGIYAGNVEKVLQHITRPSGCETTKLYYPV
jgi:hypothetical protein